MSKKMDQVSSISTNETYELSSKFKIKIPVQYQIWCAYCWLLIFVSFMVNFFYWLLRTCCVLLFLNGIFNNVSENYLRRGFFLRTLQYVGLETMSFFRDKSEVILFDIMRKNFLEILSNGSTWTLLLGKVKATLNGLW